MDYRGQFGNNLFQFAAGRILSWHTGAPMACRPLRGFSGTENHSIHFGPTRAFRTSSGGQELDLERCAAHLGSGGDVVVDAFHQHYDIYRPWKDRLKKEFSAIVCSHPHLETSDDDLVLHLRLADEDWHSSRGEAFDFAALFKTIAQQKFQRLIVVTDRSDDSRIKELRALYSIVLGPGDKLADFLTLMHARRLILTPSTFGWWPAWLSEARQILFPRHHGVWRTRRATDLWVDDESRYQIY